MWNKLEAFSIGGELILNENLIAYGEISQCGLGFGFHCE
jgi:hypothetical protein